MYIKFSLLVFHTSSLNSLGREFGFWSKVFPFVVDGHAHIFMVYRKNAKILYHHMHENGHEHKRNHFDLSVFPRAHPECLFVTRVNRIGLLGLFRQFLTISQHDRQK